MAFEGLPIVHCKRHQNNHQICGALALCKHCIDLKNWTQQ